MREKYLIFDSGALINFSTNSLLNIMRGLKKSFNGKFLITRKIKDETIDYPLKVKRFEWGALRIEQLLKEGILTLAEEDITDINELKKETQKVLEESNNTFLIDHKSLEILDEGEAECLALSRILTRQKKENVLVIDERTARILLEKPENLQKLLSKKLHTEVNSIGSSFKFFRGFKVIRSTELAYLAYKQDLILLKDKRTLEAVIYALKFGGCSISEKEAESYKRMK